MTIPTKSDYEKQWPKLAIDWGDKKIAQWNRDLAEPGKTEVEKQRLAADISHMTHIMDRLNKGHF